VSDPVFPGPGLLVVEVEVAGLVDVAGASLVFSDDDPPPSDAGDVEESVPLSLLELGTAAFVDERLSVL
jgi:hypothetical protein